jgi:hypothetical protein
MTETGTRFAYLSSTILALSLVSALTERNRQLNPAIIEVTPSVCDLGHLNM